MLFRLKNNRLSNKSVGLGNTYKQIFVALLAGSASVSYGIQTGWVSPVQQVLQSDLSPSGRPLTDGEITWIASMVFIVAMFGGFIFMFAADMYGRKIALLCTILAQATSWFILLVSAHIGAIITARACAGLGCAGTFIMVPIYIRETCQANIRGTLITLCLSSQNLGILAVYAMGSYLSFHTTIWICLSFSLMAAILVFMVSPETPPFLVKKGRTPEATVILATLRGLHVIDKTVQYEMECIESQYCTSIENITFLQILKNKASRRGYLMCVAMLGAVSFNGTTVIVTYAHRIITLCGIAIDPELKTLSVPILMIIGSIVPLTCADKIGRKPLLVSTFLLSAVGLAVVATSLLMTKIGTPLPSAVPVVAMAATVCAYAMGVLSMAHVIMSEMFRFQIRAKLVGWVMVEVWLLISVQVAFCDVMSRATGLYGVFYMFAAVNLAGGLFVAIFVPETKGKTVEQVEDIILGKTPRTNNVT